MEYLYDKTKVRYSAFIDADTNLLIKDLILFKSFFGKKLTNSLVLKKDGDKFIVVGDPGVGLQKYDEIVYKNIYDPESIKDEYLKELNFNSMDVYLIDGLSELVDSFVESDIVPASYLRTKEKVIGMIIKIKNKYKLQERIEDEK